MIQMLKMIYNLSNFEVHIADSLFFLISPLFFCLFLGFAEGKNVDYDLAKIATREWWPDDVPVTYYRNLSTMQIKKVIHSFLVVNSAKQLVS